MENTEGVGEGRETKMAKIPRTSLLSSELLKATFLGTLLILVSHALKLLVSKPPTYLQWITKVLQGIKSIPIPRSLRDI